MTGLLELPILGTIPCPQAVGSQAMISWAMMEGFQTSWSAERIPGGPSTSSF